MLTPGRQAEVAGVLEECCHIQRTMHMLSRRYDAIGNEALHIAVEHLAVRTAQLLDQAIVGLGGCAQAEALYAPSPTSEAIATDLLSRARGPK
jgi:hypothetical protein